MECCFWLVLLTPMTTLVSCKTCSLYFAVQFVIERERRGDYLGKTVQVVPHITDAIKVGLAAWSPTLALYTPAVLHVSRQLQCGVA